MTPIIPLPGHLSCQLNVTGGAISCKYLLGKSFRTVTPPKLCGQLFARQIGKSVVSVSLAMPQGETFHRAVSKGV